MNARRPDGRRRPLVVQILDACWQLLADVATWALFTACHLRQPIRTH